MSIKSKQQQQPAEHQFSVNKDVSIDAFYYLHSLMSPTIFKLLVQRYVGDIDPVTKLRCGEGVYTYENQFFQYKGQWENGIKSGTGILLMKDGGRYEGDFSEGEMTGKGQRHYADGSVYKGEFAQGERNGYGEITYAKLGSGPTGEWYKGNWQLNVRQGQGTMYTKEKSTFTVSTSQMMSSRVNSEITGPTVCA